MWRRTRSGRGGSQWARRARDNTCCDSCPTNMAVTLAVAVAVEALLGAAPVPLMSSPSLSPLPCPRRPPPNAATRKVALHADDNSLFAPSSITGGPALDLPPPPPPPPSPPAPPAPPVFVPLPPLLQALLRHAARPMASAAVDLLPAPPAVCPGAFAGLKSNAAEVHVLPRRPGSHGETGVAAAAAAAAAAGGGG